MPSYKISPAPYPVLRARIAALDRATQGRHYNGYHTYALDIISDARTALINQHGDIAPREAEDLECAVRAVNNDLLTLALSLVIDALRARAGESAWQTGGARQDQVSQYGSEDFIDL